MNLFYKIFGMRIRIDQDLTKSEIETLKALQAHTIYRYETIIDCYRRTGRNADLLAALLKFCDMTAQAPEDVCRDWHAGNVKIITLPDELQNENHGPRNNEQRRMDNQTGINPVPPQGAN